MLLFRETEGRNELDAACGKFSYDELLSDCQYDDDGDESFWEDGIICGAGGNGTFGLPLLP